MTAADGAMPESTAWLGGTGRAALAVMGIRVAGAGLAFLTQIMLARLLGPASYGVFATFWVLIIVLIPGAVLGLAQAACRFVPEHRVHGDLGLLRGFLLGGAGLSAAGGLLMAGFGGAVVWLAPSLFSPEEHTAFLVALAVLPLVALQDFVEGVARGFAWPALAIAPIYLLRQALLAAFLAGGVALGASADAATALSAALLATVLALGWQAAVLVRRLRRALPPGPRAFDLRRWLGAALPMALVEWTALGLSYADVLILGVFWPPETVAMYFAATRLLGLALFVPYAAMAATVPAFVEAHARGARDQLRRQVRRTARLTCLATLAAGLGALGAAPWLLDLFGPGFSEGAGLLAILLAGVAVQAAAGPAENLLTVLGQERLCTAISAAALVVAVILHFLLIPTFGATGAAAVAATVVAGRGMALAWAVRARLGFGADIFTREALH